MFLSCFVIAWLRDRCSRFREHSALLERRISQCCNSRQSAGSALVCGSRFLHHASRGQCLAGNAVQVMGEPASCAWLCNVRPGFKWSMGKSTDCLECFEGIHIVFLTAVSDKNVSFLHNENSLIQSFYRLIIIAHLT